MSKILEVIVTSLDDSLAAQEGGADRLEVVRDLDSGGLTPDVSLVAEICCAVHIPVRVMIRDSPTMSVNGNGELEGLRCRVVALGRLPLDGLVLGFVASQRVDLHAVRTLLLAAPHLRATFHRAFDCLADPIEGISILKTFPQIDRILTVGGCGDWQVRHSRLQEWQRQAHPQIKILAGAGTVPTVLSDLSTDSIIQEVHVGRAARDPQENCGTVSRVQVARLKGLFA